MNERGAMHGGHSVATTTSRPHQFGAPATGVAPGADEIFYGILIAPDAILMPS